VRSRKAYQLGDPITVRLVEVAPLKGGLKFELAGQAAQATATGKKKPGKRPRR